MVDAETGRPGDPRVSLVIGAAGGIGRAIATRLAAAGGVLELADRDRVALAEVTANLPGGRATGHVVDVSVADEVGALCLDVLRWHGRIDLLVLAAGVPGEMRAGWRASAEEWERVLAINAGQVVHAVRHVLPAMVERDSGSIAVVASLAGLVPAVAGAAYAASKHAVVGYLASVQEELRALGSAVRITVAVPGFVRTGFAAIVAPPSSPAAVDAGVIARADALGAAAADRARRAIADGIPADEHAEQVLHAVETGAFWAFSEPGHAGLVLRNAELVVRGEAPRAPSSRP